MIDPYNNAQFSDLLSGQEGIEASTTAKVDHDLTLAVRQRLYQDEYKQINLV